MRRAPKLDRNHNEVVRALVNAHCRVQSLAGAAGGVPDLLVGHRGQLLLLEIKDGSLSPSHRTLTPTQEAWHAAWKGYPVHTVTSADEALAIIAK